MTNATHIEAIEMPAGWYAKTMHHFAVEHGPHKTQAQAISAVKAEADSKGWSLSTVGLKTWNHRGGIMCVAR
jgi:hypothetical protein